MIEHRFVQIKFIGLYYMTLGFRKNIFKWIFIKFIQRMIFVSIIYFKGIFEKLN